jgi:hypothetical protein
MSDAEIVDVVHQGTYLLKRGVARYSERIQVNGLWVVVRVLKADDQQPGPNYDGRTGEPLFPMTREQRQAQVAQTLASIKQLERERGEP